MLDGALPLSTSLREAVAGHGHKARKMARLSRTLHLTEGKQAQQDVQIFPVDALLGNGRTGFTEVLPNLAIVSRHCAIWWVGAGSAAGEFPCYQVTVTFLRPARNPMGVYSQALPVQLISSDSSILGTTISELPQYPAPSPRHRCTLIYLIPDKSVLSLAHSTQVHHYWAIGHYHRQVCRLACICPLWAE